MTHVYPLETTAEVDPFIIDTKTRVVMRGSRSVRLTKFQFRLLAFLALHFNTLVRKEELYEKVWRVPRPDPRIIDVTICNIRKKLATLGHDSERHLWSKWGVGYMLCSIPQRPLREVQSEREAWMAERDRTFGLMIKGMKERMRALYLVS